MKRCIPLPFLLVILLLVVGNGERGISEHDGSRVSAGCVTLVRTTVQSTVGLRDNTVTCLTQYFVERTLFISLFSFRVWVTALGEHLQEVALISHFS